MSRKKKQPVLFQEGNCYIFVLPESPKGFKDSLFVTWEGESPDNLTETVKTAGQLKTLHRVELTSISAEWRAAFSKATGLSLPEPAPPALPATPATPATQAAPVEKKPDPFVQWAPLCVTWVWAFGIATLVAWLLGIIKH